ncbi:hypothetical protein [Cellulomonas sp. NTE-D12]|uniref:hypothetical protein n=1 Tax=Cellulomonas sp. NTE-D12 TaxID=2962632 RepID=UPI0030814E31
MLACFVPVAALGTLIGLTSVLGDCGFDPPPGDVGSVTLTNDLTRAISFQTCLNAQCTRRDDVGSSGPIAPGASLERNHELCSEESVGVLDRNGRLLGCVVLPAEDPATVTRFYASASNPCR